MVVAVDEAVARGAAVYRARTLRFYDAVVHGVSNRIAWRCPTRALLELYDRHVSERHLDVGVGSGYFLDRCLFPVPEPHITLVDLNPAALEFTRQRVARYHPRTLLANALEPIAPADGPFRSIGMMYLLHCLPGPLQAKARVFSVLGAHLARGGVLFGATILAAGVERSLPARALMRAYNRKGIFGNAGDSLEQLEAALAARFEQHEVRVHGCVALFSASGFSA
jgi:SAM-dependent methyltransferase